MTRAVKVYERVVADPLRKLDGRRPRGEMAAWTIGGRIRSIAAAGTAAGT